MARAYPKSFPLPAVEGFQIDVAMGAVHSTFDGHNSQRRVFKTMPHTFTLAFFLSEKGWATWNEWVVLYGRDWFDIDLPNLYAGQLGKNYTPTTIRLVSGCSVQPVTQMYFRVTVQAEMSPTMIKRYLGAA